MSFYGHDDAAIEHAMNAFKRIIAKQADTDNDAYPDVAGTVRFVLDAKAELERRRGEEEQKS